MLGVEACKGVSSTQNAWTALTGRVQWVGHRPAKLKVTSSIPVQDRCLACGCGPPSGSEQETTDGHFSLASVFLSLFLPPFPSLLRMNKFSK